MAIDTEIMSQSLNINTIHKSVLVVGGAGYIGSHTAKQLKKNGFTPVVVDRDIKSKPWATQYGPAFEINLPRDIDLLDEIIKRYNIDSCIHFAAYTRVGESVSDPSKYYLNNVVMTLRLLDKLRSLGVSKFVFSSSAATYGIPKNGIGKTNDIPQPINPYGRTKFIVEEILKDYFVAYNMRSVSLRYFNASGADIDNEIGQYETNEKFTHIIPVAIEAAKKETVFKLYGTDFDTPDGSCVRDYIHVTDLADGHIQSLLKINDENICERYNLGTGIGISNLEILSTIEKYVGPIKIVKSERRPGDPPSLIADISQTLKELNWKPKHSSIDNIIQTAVKWYNKTNSEKIN